MSKAINTVAEQKIHLELPDVSIPLTGYIDLVSNGNLYEMKTKAPRKGQIKKDGTRGWSKPALPKEPDYNHLCQVAVYQKATGLKPNIVYISDTDVAHFDQDNCDKLSPEYLEYCLYDLRRRALIRQNLLAISTDPKVLAGLVEPEFNHPFYWKNQFIDFDAFFVKVSRNRTLGTRNYVLGSMFVLTHAL